MKSDKFQRPTSKNAFRILAVVVILLFLFSCHTDNITYKQGTLSDIFNEARFKKKKVFILVTDSLCNRCKEFERQLNAETFTVDILRQEYISYKVNVRDPQYKITAQILKCPAFPFPYFFDSDGKIIAFGYPNEKEYDLRKTAAIKVEEFTFKEMFKMNIPVAKYKQMVYYTLNAYLEMKSAERNSGDFHKAYELIEQSITTAPYPYNLYLGYQLSKKQELYTKSREYINQIKLNYKPADRFMYGTMMNDLGLPDDAYTKEISGADSTGVLYDNKERIYQDVKLGSDVPFSFTFMNTGSQPLLIEKAHHPCNCIDLEWTRNIIATNDTGTIRGVFHANEKGTFYKEIYVHTNNTTSPMNTIVLRGEVIP